MNDEELLKKLYYKDLTFGGVQNLYKKAKEAHPKITLKIVKEWLDKQQAAQLNNKPVIKYDFKPIYSEQPYAFQIDLTFFPRYKKQNENNWVLFTAININTRFGYAYYAKDKESSTIINFITDLEKKTIINVLEPVLFTISVITKFMLWVTQICLTHLMLSKKTYRFFFYFFCK
jgi:hypothetical protein